MPDPMPPLESFESPDPPNAFAPSFLAELATRDEPGGALEAETDGEWFVATLSAGRHALYRSWQSWAAGHVPPALFARLEDALLAAAIRPAIGRDPRFFLDPSPTADGFHLLHLARTPEEGPTLVGALRHREDAMLRALDLATWLARHPLAMALILEVGGPGAIRTTGEILDFRVRTAGRRGAGWASSIQGPPG